jgi:hypothetical protein
MDEMVQTQLAEVGSRDHRQAWEMVSGQLRLEMSRTMYETYIQPLQALGYKDGVFKLGAYNPYIRDWVESRLKSLITRQLEGQFNRAVTLKIQMVDESKPRQPDLVRIEEQPQEQVEQTPAPSSNGKASSRKLALQRAYGSKRAAVIQPERSLMVTQYLFASWLPLIGHSAFTVILAARSMCYWNPISGELRNEIETEMAELAERAALSVRTVKTVLNDELVRKYFLRYRTRRVMTPNGVRTAGIQLYVRMDDPLTPEDQSKYNLPEEEFWYSPEYGDPEE